MIVAQLMWILVVDQTKPVRLPNVQTKIWATRLLNSRITKVEVSGRGLSRKPVTDPIYKEAVFTKQTDIRQILKAFQQSTRKARYPEDGQNHDGADMFKFFLVDAKKKTTEVKIFVVDREIDEMWGPPLKKMYELLRKKAKSVGP